MTKAHLTLQTTEGKEALAYLREERGLTDEAINAFQIGYVPARVNHELAGRVLTPLFDSYGNLVAITSRHLKQKKNFWHESFDKSFHLYGLNIAKPHILKYGYAVLVEGEFDVAYLFGQSVKMTVGVCGSALTVFQASLLARYCQKVFIVFDRDKNGSGQRATRRVIKLGKETLFEMDLIPVELPIGVDPDDFIKNNGVREFASILKSSEERFNDFALKDQ